MKKINISQVDALFASGIYQIEFLFYFEGGLNTKGIRNALKKLSGIFWPMFGEYKDGVISFDKYVEEDFYDEVAIGHKFITSPTEEKKLDTYSMYRLRDTKKLFLLKITKFQNGTIMVPKMNHLAGDGYSYFYFLSSLALLSQQTLLPSKSSLMQLFFKPQHRRTILKNFSLEGAELECLKQDKQFTTGTEEVCRKDVSALIRNVAASKNLRISTNDVLTAIALKRLASVQKKIEGESVELTIPIDVRRQVREFGRRFFGNGLMLHMMKLRRDDIKNLPTEEMAVLIRNGMPSVTKRSYLDYLKGLEEILSAEKPERWRPFDPDSGFLVTNISRLPVDKLDFGTGPPDLVYPLTIEKNAAAILAKDENFILRSAL